MFLFCSVKRQRQSVGRQKWRASDWFMRFTRRGFIFSSARSAAATRILAGRSQSGIIGQTFGPKPLHQVARLSAWHIPALGQNYTNPLPLIFGMHFDGCQLSYRVHSGHKVEILKIEPDRSLDDWPYPNFPPLLPYIPLRLEDTPRSES